MRSILLLSVLVFSMISLRAQDYQISFTGSGSASTVDSVKVENLTQETSMMMSGNDILNLKGSVGIDDQETTFDHVRIHPNPMQGESTLEFLNRHHGEIWISISDIQGKDVVHFNRSCEEGWQNFLLSGLKQGVYFINIIAGGSNSSVKLVSLGRSLNTPQILPVVKGVLLTEGNPVPDGHKEKSGDAKKSLVVMQYNNGDQLKITGKSGNYQTVYMLVPTVNQSVTFNFTPCVDGSGNNYPVVQIGGQTWMAANLRTTAFSNTSSIPHITEPTTWAGLTTPAYCMYTNNEPFVVTYGLLYNGFAAMSGNLCPGGWHVPTDAEWTTMEIFLQNNGYNYDGSVDTDNDRFTNNKTAKSLASNENWDFSPNAGAIGNDLSKNNKSGFTAYAGGYRFETGTFDYIHMYGLWWTSTNISGSTLYRALYMTESDVKRNMLNNRYGYSVRCIKD